MEKPPNRLVPSQKTAAIQPFLSGARHHPENKIRPLLPAFNYPHPFCSTARAHPRARPGHGPLTPSDTPSVLYAGLQMDWPWERG